METKKALSGYATERPKRCTTSICISSYHQQCRLVVSVEHQIHTSYSEINTLEVRDALAISSTWPIGLDAGLG